MLNEYIGNGQPWDLDRLYGGVHVLTKKGSGYDPAERYPSRFHGAEPVSYTHLYYVYQEVPYEFINNREIIGK